MQAARQSGERIGDKMIDEMVRVSKMHIIDMCLKWHDIIAGILLPFMALRGPERS